MKLPLDKGTRQGRRCRFKRQLLGCVLFVLSALECSRRYAHDHAVMVSSILIILFVTRELGVKDMRESDRGYFRKCANSISMLELALRSSDESLVSM